MRPDFLYAVWLAASGVAVDFVASVAVWNICFPAPDADDDEFREASSQIVYQSQREAVMEIAPSDNDSAEESLRLTADQKKAAPALAATQGAHQQEPPSAGSETFGDRGGAASVDVEAAQSQSPTDQSGKGVHAESLGYFVDSPADDGGGSPASLASLSPEVTLTSATAPSSDEAEGAQQLQQQAIEQLQGQQNDSGNIRQELHVASATTRIPTPGLKDAMQAITQSRQGDTAAKPDPNEARPPILGLSETVRTPFSTQLQHAQGVPSPRRKLTAEEKQKHPFFGEVEHAEQHQGEDPLQSPRAGYTERVRLLMQKLDNNKEAPDTLVKEEFEEDIMTVVSVLRRRWRDQSKELNSTDDLSSLIGKAKVTEKQHVSKKWGMERGQNLVTLVDQSNRTVKKEEWPEEKGSDATLTQATDPPVGEEQTFGVIRWANLKVVPEGDTDKTWTQLTRLIAVARWVVAHYLGKSWGDFFDGTLSELADKLTVTQAEEETEFGRKMNIDSIKNYITRRITRNLEAVRRGKLTEEEK